MEQRKVTIIDQAASTNMSTIGSDKKSKNDHETLSSNDHLAVAYYGNGLNSYRKEERKKSQNLRFNSDKSEVGIVRRADYSVDSSSVMNNRSLRDAESHLRGSHKNLAESGKLLRESGGIESVINDFNLKRKNTRIHGV